MGAFSRLRPKPSSLDVGGNESGSSPSEEIRRGSAVGASPRNGYRSGGKTSGEDASLGMFECAPCVASRFVTADMSSTARAKQGGIVRRDWRSCQQQSCVWKVLPAETVKNPGGNDAIAEEANHSMTGQQLARPGRMGNRVPGAAGHG
jgi:hypothetical protein